MLALRQRLRGAMTSTPTSPLLSLGWYRGAEPDAPEWFRNALAQAPERGWLVADMARDWSRVFAEPV